MSLHNTDIQGNANISRNANVGGHAKVNGDVTVGHNLFVKGWVDAPHIKGPCKGLYASEEALKEAYPRPMPGWYALVGDGLPAAVWRAAGAVWVPTGETGGAPVLWLDVLEGDVRDLRETVLDLRERVGELETEVRDGLAGLRAELGALGGRVETLERAGAGIDLSELDGARTYRDLGWRYLYDGNPGYAVGHVLVTTDAGRHCVIQVVAGNFSLDKEGRLSRGHRDGEVTVMWRSYRMAGGTDTVPLREWTEWGCLELGTLAGWISSGERPGTPETPGERPETPGENPGVCTGLRTVLFDGTAQVEGDFLVSSSLGADYGEGRLVVWESTGGRFLLSVRATGVLKPDYYNNWPGAEEYGVRDGAYVRPKEGILYVEREVGRIWMMAGGEFVRTSMCDGDESSLRSDHDAEVWAEGKEYAAGQRVYDRGQLWGCLRGHVSAQENEPGYATEGVVWEWLMGDGELHAVFTSGEVLVDPEHMDFELGLTVRYHGEDVTGFLNSGTDVAWSRYSETAGGIERAGLDEAWTEANRRSGVRRRMTSGDLDWGLSQGVGRMEFRADVTLGGRSGRAVWALG